MPSLPSLTDRPAVYAGCCLALSTPLVAHLHSLLPKAPALTLSIGSGFGLLEALLLAGPAPQAGELGPGDEVDPTRGHHPPRV